MYHKFWGITSGISFPKNGQKILVSLLVDQQLIFGGVFNCITMINMFRVLHHDRQVHHHHKKHVNNRDKHMYHCLLLSSPFDAIADFARRSTGGGGGRSRRDDSRDRDLRSDISFLNKMNKNVGVHENSIILITLNTEPKSRHEMSVPNDVVGSVIGKRGSKINEIRQIRYLMIAKHDLGLKRNIPFSQWSYNQHHGKRPEEEGEKS